MTDNRLSIIGRAERIDLPDFGATMIPARVDTGAKTSALWASDIVEKDGRLMFRLFGESSEFYSGEEINVAEYGRRLVSNSTGHVEQRYTIKTQVIVQKRKVLATFTLANRSSQVYPILLGRNILRGKFVVDVKLGSPLIAEERQRELQKLYATKNQQPESKA